MADKLILEDLQASSAAPDSSVPKQPLVLEDLPGNSSPSEDQSGVTSGAAAQTNAVFLPDKNVTFGYPSTMSPEEAQARVREKAYSIPFNVPSYIRDQGNISAKPVSATLNYSLEDVANAPQATPRTPTLGEQIAYPYARLYSETIEKPAWAVTQLALQGLNAVYKYGENLIDDHSLASGIANHDPGWLDRAVDFYSNPEQNAPVTPGVTRMRAELRAAAYHRNFAVGIAGDVAENVTDLMAFLLPIDAEAKFAQEAAKGKLMMDSPMITQFARNTTKLAGYGFVRTNGSLTQRGRSATQLLAYSMAPYIAQATGATGLSVKGIAAALNVFVSSPTYAAAFNQSGGMNRDFAAMVVPQFIMDLGFALHTQGLPENEAQAKFETIFKKRAKEMKLPKNEAQALMKRLWNAAKNPDEATQTGGAAGIEDPHSDNLYVKNEPIILTLGKDEKKSSDNLRLEFSGVKNSQIVRGNQLADALKALVPDKLQREGITLYKEAEGDLMKITDRLDGIAKNGEKSKYFPFKAQLEAALKITPQMREVLDKMAVFYDEAGQVSKEIGTIDDVLENYQARFYEPTKEQGTLNREPSSGLKQTTPHGLERKFPTLFDAIDSGMKPSTLDAADILALYNESMARVNTSRKLADLLVDNNSAAWAQKVPPGWKQVGNLKKTTTVLDQEGKPIINQSYLVAPENIANGMAAIANPDFIQQVDILAKAGRFQGLVKTQKLAYSFFHHFTMGAQTIYQGGIRALMNMPNMEKFLSSAPFAELEQDLTRHGGMTSKVQSNQDILKNLTADTEDTFSKVVNAPVIKQSLALADKSTNFLFGHIQRFLKVSDYGAKVSDWIANHPTATDEQIIKAKQGFAKEINAAYGGLNWEAMGVTKDHLSILRGFLLAPDWLTSSGALLKYAVSDTGTAGAASRANLAVALVGGMALTEGLNKILTGHFTDENKKGHKLEVEVQPDVYVSLLRGGPGEIANLASQTSEFGLMGGARYVSGKLAPFPQTISRLLLNADVTGAPIHKAGDKVFGSGAISGTWDALKFAAKMTGPIPIGVANLWRYIQDEHKTALGFGLIASGVGRYSVSGSRKNARRRL